MYISYDTTADAAYLKLNDAPIAATNKINDRLTVDVDGKGNIVGIEMLDFSSNKENLISLEKNSKAGIPVRIISSTSPLMTQ